MKVMWFPPDGSDPLTFGATRPYVLLEASGLVTNTNDAQTQKAPGQTGETFVDNVVAPRVVALTVQAVPEIGGSLAALRSELAGALVSVPGEFGASPALGTLRLIREGQPDLDLLAVPRDSPREIDQASYPTSLRAGIEFFAAYPFWRETADRFQVLESAGGFTWPLVFPLAMPSNNITSEIDNSGHAPAPILARLYGDCTDAVLANLTTGQQIKVTGQINAGEYVEIATDFGGKSVTLVAADGARTDAMSRLDLTVSQLWTLRRGLNSVSFSAATNISGKAVVYWRQRYVGG